MKTNLTAPPEIFDKQRWQARRRRSTAIFGEHDFLHQRAMTDLVDRLETVTRNFPYALFYGVGELRAQLTPEAKVEQIVHADCVRGRLPAKVGSNLLFDEESQPLHDRKFDLAVSLLTLHAVNDLVGTLIQYRRSLKPDGLFLAAMFGGETLSNFRHALYEAEMEVSGGISNRVHPFADIKDIGGALSRAGFALPVTDVDHVNVRYAHPMHLLRDLRGMGETNYLADVPRPLRRSILMRANDKFLQNFDGYVQFDIIYLTAWAPADSQPKPLRPGSAKISMEKIVKGF